MVALVEVLVQEGEVQVVAGEVQQEVEVDVEQVQGVEQRMVAVVRQHVAEVVQGKDVKRGQGGGRGTVEARGTAAGVRQCAAEAVRGKAAERGQAGRDSMGTQERQAR